MSAKSYSEKLKDPRWQRKRLEVLETTDFHCESCSDHESTLHVHHKLYLKGKEPWEYNRKQLVVLCDRCHENIHAENQFEELASMISMVPIDGPINARGISIMLCGMLVGHQLHAEDSPDLAEERSYFIAGIEARDKILSLLKECKNA